jgi:serine/threonine protein kinase
MGNQILQNRYCIQSLLSRKPGRRTALASDLQTHASVIVKLLLFGPDFTWEDLKLFEREAETLKALNHPTIPQYLDSFEVDAELGKGFALVQTHIEARSLQDWMQTGHIFSEEELRAIAKELLEILDYLHTLQPPVIHRDIKPSNVLLGDRSGDYPGKVYLVDFGSVQTALHGGTVTVVGTYGYMPPEQFGGRTTPASDLYSLGATLIYLLTKTHPADLPSRNGFIQFEAKLSTSTQFQTWLRYLIQPDVSQRFQSAQLALEALQNDQLVSSAHAVPSKPSGSRITLTKTDAQLKIVISPLRIKQKLGVIFSILWGTAFACSPLLLGFWKPAAGLWITPLVLYVVVSIWVKDGYRLFAKMQMLIDESRIYFMFGWLGFKRRYSSSAKDITKLERLRFTIDNQVPNNPQAQYSGLHLWVGNQCHSFKVFSLTEVELDWLAAELSEWLNLPIQTSGEVITSDPVHSSRTFTKMTDTQSNSTESSPSISLTPPSGLSRINRPANAQCVVDKDIKAIRISAPAGNGIVLQILVCIVGLFLFIMSLSINPFAALIIGTTCVVFWKIGDRLNCRSQTTRIILRIDQQDISLWKESLSRQPRCFKKIARSAIQKLQLVYRREAGGQSYHIKICTADSSCIRKDGFLIGNRLFWLSRREAEWLAHELSVWLKLPVTEVEVVDNGA